MAKTIWLRSETKKNERRTPLTPLDAKRLIDDGNKVIVESSKDRIFKDSLYKEVGCDLVQEHSWIKDAPKDAFILGLKELDTQDFALTHNHIYFAHIYKNQDGHEQVFERYKKGGGTLFDLEFLQDESGKRVSAFGYWAGYVGAALAVECYSHKKDNQSLPSLKSYETKDQWLEIIRPKIEKCLKPSTIIIGAKGRCGTGARDLLTDLNLSSTNWDYEETKKGGPFKEIVEHNIFINTVLMTKKIAPFIDKSIIDENSKLNIIGDVSCDPNSELNPIPIYNTHTSWSKPTVEVNKSLEVIAIDNLPSALPKESSEDFSSQLVPHLLNLCKEGLDNYVWRNAKDIFNDKLQSTK